MLLGAGDKLGAQQRLPHSVATGEAGLWSRWCSASLSGAFPGELLAPLLHDFGACVEEV